MKLNVAMMFGLNKMIPTLKKNSSTTGVHFKMSHRCVESGRWGHRPRQAARVGVPTNPRHFEINDNILKKEITEELLSLWPN